MVPWRPQAPPPTPHLLCSSLPIPWWVLGQLVGEAMGPALPPDTWSREPFAAPKQMLFFINVIPAAQDSPSLEVQKTFPQWKPQRPLQSLQGPGPGKMGLWTPGPCFRLRDHCPSSVGVTSIQTWNLNLCFLKYTHTSTMKPSGWEEVSPRTRGAERIHSRGVHLILCCQTPLC